MFRGTFVEIDLSAIKGNLLLVRKMIGPGVKILLPVKADAYGHGIVEVSRYVEQQGLAEMLGVACLDEGVEIRKAGISLPLLVLGLIVPESAGIRVLIKHQLTQTVADFETARLISGESAAEGITVPVHLKIDTGMGRIGCRPEETADIVRRISDLKNVTLQGLYSHFPDADGTDMDFTSNQIAMFRKIAEDLSQQGINIPLKHLANSAGIIRFPESHFNMVRPGIMAYGYMPSLGMPQAVPVVPSMKLASRVVYIKRVGPGTPLSYGRTYVTESACSIATVPVGYGDGYNRLLSNKAKVIINGKQYPVVGRVSMDQILINLGDDSCTLGQEVVLFADKEITASTIAEWIGTIPYEVTCGISKRVPRIYTERKNV